MNNQATALSSNDIELQNEEALNKILEDVIDNTAEAMMHSESHARHQLQGILNDLNQAAKDKACSPADLILKNRECARKAAFATYFLLKTTFEYYSDTEIKEECGLFKFSQFQIKLDKLMGGFSS